ncbi:MAG: bifunctional proline dehydrogenase/L-glutamate gamma-semialdehyde dehydrogenase PutA [Oleiphilaceae bacterium]|nr:bifunctional proline dehydrogenase/L-glutamate gamma-semialdehyde dehydrogenase PutA [Oleiphilaceae bacterium]
MQLQELFDHINTFYSCDHRQCILRLREYIPDADYPPSRLEHIAEQALSLCSQAREATLAHDPIQQLLSEYSLSSDEGLALMVLVEALSRTTDTRVAAQLLGDSLQHIDWHQHIDSHKPLFTNISALLLLLTGKMMQNDNDTQLKLLRRLLRKLSQPMVHASMRAVIHHIASQFVYATDIHQALDTTASRAKRFELYSFDMLGEEALTTHRAHVYLNRYREAAESVVQANQTERCGISIKLSALDPRYEPRHTSVCEQRIVEGLLPLVDLARQHDLQMTIDAEESFRLASSLRIFTKLVRQTGIRGESPLGLAVQAYSPRALAVLKYLREFAASRNLSIPVRLVKGAYWDSEVKMAQLQGLASFPVFTSKQHTDLSYLACAHYLLEQHHYFYPQFATHNATTICHLLDLNASHDRFEFQRLHGMGEQLYDLLCQRNSSLKVRVYGPVGSETELLPYLIRRLLENGANNSFVRQMLHDEHTTKKLCEHPLQDTDDATPEPRTPDSLYEPERSNSNGLNLANEQQRDGLLDALRASEEKIWDFCQSDASLPHSAAIHYVINPYDGSTVGHIHLHQPSALDIMGERAHSAWQTWRNISINQRAEIIAHFAVALEANRTALISLLIREAGKTIQDAIDEVREAIDFAHFYARQGLQLFGNTTRLPGAAGEENLALWQSRGPFLCISPWNFPLAIFTGQICAALVCGNSVIAKPSGHTPLIAMYCAELWQQSGLPEHILQIALSSGDDVSEWIKRDKHLRGIAFTGSNSSAQTIHRALAARQGPRLSFIAETGGQNVMITDCTSLPEQLCKDVVHSAFYSAGQRCSALRVLFLQSGMQEDFLSLLKGHLETLVVGNPAHIQTDIGPIIHHSAKQSLQKYCEQFGQNNRLIYAGSLPHSQRNDNLFPPHVLAISDLAELSEEQFGPVLHIVEYDYDNIEHVIKSINESGYGLTCGIHSRNIAWAKRLATQLRVGNVYINRNMTGAIVAAQPFGGMGLSGTGPKAGGKEYIKAFACEQTISHNSAALGGAIELLTRPQ